MSFQATEQKAAPRLMFRFWLSAGKNEELELADFCERLKSERSFVRTVRQGLTLIRDLRRGDTSSLFAMFPDLREHLVPRKPDTDPAPGGDDLLTKIDRLEKLLIQQSTSGGVLPNIYQQQGLAPLKERPALPAPRSLGEPFADNEPGIAISRAKVDHDAILNNFLSSMGSLGISAAPQAVGAPKPLAGANIKFAPPIDDDSEEINLFS